MKGIARTQKEIEFHDRVAQLGCISCRQEGNYNPWVSIHHAHGRTKPGCHMWVLPLCEPHHQDNGTAIARHPYKRRWEAKYGNEDDLIRAMWTELGVEFTEPVRVAKTVDKDRPKRATSEIAEIGVVKLREIKPKVDKPARAKIQTARRIQVCPERSALPKAKTTIFSPSKIKNKIKNAGFSANSTLKRQQGKNKQLKVSQETLAKASVFEKNKSNSTSASIEYKEKAKLASKARQAAYLEANKDAIENRKREAKELRKKIRAKSVSSEK